MGQFEASISLKLRSSFLPLSQTGRRRGLPLNSPAEHVTSHFPPNSIELEIPRPFGFLPGQLPSLATPQILRFQRHLKVTPLRGKLFREIISSLQFRPCKSRIVYHLNLLGNLPVKRSALGLEMRLFSRTRHQFYSVDRFGF